MHHYYNLDGITDLAVTRSQANERTKPGNKFSGPYAEESVIHFHKHDEPCSPLIQHEFYAVPPLTVEEVAKTFWINTGGHNGN